MNNNIESNTKGGSSPTRLRGTASSHSSPRTSTEDTLMDALFHNTRRWCQRTTEDGSTPCLDEASGAGSLLVSPGSNHPDDTAQPSSGLRLNASSPREMDNQFTMRARQTGRRLLPLNSGVPVQGNFRLDASREEILVDILAEAIEVNASLNLGTVNSTTTDHQQQQGPAERENQHDQQ